MSIMTLSSGCYLNIKIKKKPYQKTTRLKIMTPQPPHYLDTFKKAPEVKSITNQNTKSRYPAMVCPIRLKTNPKNKPVSNLNPNSVRLTEEVLILV